MMRLPVLLSLMFIMTACSLMPDFIQLKDDAVKVEQDIEKIEADAKGAK